MCKKLFKNGHLFNKYTLEVTAESFPHLTLFNIINSVKVAY